MIIVEHSDAIRIGTDRNDVLDIIVKNKIVSLELCDFIFGKFLGYGASRFVFEYMPDPKLVIKIDCSDFNANVIEYAIWNKVSDCEKLSKWFAPCNSISRCGRILLQRKVKTGIPYEEYPKKIPSFLNDTKYRNFGKINDRIVCVDYSSVRIDQIGTGKMVTAIYIDL